MTQKNYTYIPKRQKCINKEEPYIGGAEDIVDDDLHLTQAQINAEVNETLTNHSSAINGLNSQNYVTVTATDQTTSETDVLPATGSVDTVYRVGNWDGSQFDETVYSEYAWNGSQYVHLSTKTQISDDNGYDRSHCNRFAYDKMANLVADWILNL